MSWAWGCRRPSDTRTRPLGPDALATPGTGVEVSLGSWLQGRGLQWACGLRVPLPADEHAPAPPGQAGPRGALRGRLPGPPAEAAVPPGLLVPAGL